MASPPRDTIYALSSGRIPAAIAVVRISGPRAGDALKALSGKIPEPRKAAFARVRDPASGEIIDEALALWFPGPNSETGEDIAELQLHGGRAVLAAVFAALGRMDGLRPAEAGEFTRRAFENGKIDLTAVEGLADLVGAETEGQRRQALGQMQGRLRARADAWREKLISALALVEAGIDFSDEGDVPAELTAPALAIARELEAEIAAALADGRRGERLREGMVVAIAGPPNAGKSTLLNRLAQREVAIVSPHAGTTRDVIEVHLDLGGWPVTLLDTAGIRETADPVELEGVRRARERAATADLVLWVVDASEDAWEAGPAGGTGAGGPAAGAAGVEAGVGDPEVGAAGRDGGGRALGSAGPLGQRPRQGGGADAGGTRATDAMGPPEAPGAATTEPEGLDALSSSSPPQGRNENGGDPDRHRGAEREPFRARDTSDPPQGPPVWLILNKADLVKDLSSGSLDPTGQARHGTLQAADLNLSPSSASGRSGSQSGSPTASRFGSSTVAGEGDGTTQPGSATGSLFPHATQPGERHGPDFMLRSPAGPRLPPNTATATASEQICPASARPSKNDSKEYLYYCRFILSSLVGSGLGALITGLRQQAEDLLSGAEPALVTRERQRRALEDAKSALQRALSGPLAEDLLAEELHLASRALSRLTGRIDVEDILDVIFRDFCVGK